MAHHNELLPRESSRNDQIAEQMLSRANLHTTNMHIRAILEDHYASYHEPQPEAPLDFND